MIVLYKHLSSKLYLVLVFLFSSILLLLFSIFTIQQEFNDDFDWNLYTASQDISNKLENFADLLYSFRGFFYSSTNVTQEEWDIFHMSFNAESRYEFTAELAYIEYLNHNEIKNPVSYKNLSDHEEHYVVKYHSGHLLNESAVGIDLGSEIERYEALSWARDNNKIVSIPPVNLMVKDNTKGVVLFLPVYDIFKPLNTLSQKRQNLEGFVAYIIPLDKFIEEIINPDIMSTLKFKITDRKTKTLVFQNSESIEKHYNVLSKKLDLKFGNRNWDLEFYDLRVNYASKSDWILIIVGVFTTCNSLLLLWAHFKFKRKKQNITAPLDSI